MKYFAWWISGFVVGLSVGVVNAADIGLLWDPSPETNVTYRAYRSLRPGAITNFVETVSAGTNTTCRIGAGNPGVVSYYVVTALDTQGNESLPSNEILYIVPWIHREFFPGIMRLEFLRVNHAGTNVRYTLEVSENLINWRDQTEFQPTIFPVSDGVEHYRVDIPTIAEKLFARIRVDIL